MPGPRATAAPAGPRRATNVTLPETLLGEARELEINLSQACERGVMAEVAAIRRKRRLAANQTAMQDWNDHVDRNGLPPAAYRQF